MHSLECQEYELSRPIDAARLAADGQAFALTATPAECAALATRFGILAIRSLTATLQLKKLGKREVFRLEGRFEATVEQTCVISLEPVKTVIREAVSATFAEDAASDRGTVDLEPDDEDPPEPIGKDGIDAGEVVAQHLALALPAYPRSDEAGWDEGRWQDQESESVENPFTVLKPLIPH